HAGVAGIYGVATIPQYRRQGIAATMTLHALHEAHKLGYRISILSPSKMSDALYRRIGFRDFCTIMHHGWSAGL
ncbi:MAG TPA: GNAT family N-acetyltransferase, partial [Ktedonobacteraceae bacterium]|nr:GNAT family N-acetyltransferase [Ktedonobacteraceae bacterium]